MLARLTLARAHCCRSSSSPGWPWSTFPPPCAQLSPDDEDDVVVLFVENSRLSVATRHDIAVRLIARSLVVKQVTDTETGVHPIFSTAQDPTREQDARGWLAKAKQIRKMNMMTDQTPPMDARQFGHGSDGGKGSEDLQPSQFASPTSTFNPGAEVQHTTSAKATPTAANGNAPAVNFDITTRLAPQDRIFSVAKEHRHLFGYTPANASVELQYVQWLSRASASDEYKWFAATNSPPQDLIQLDDDGAILFLDKLSDVGADMRGSMSLRSEGDSQYRKEMVVRVGWVYNNKTQGYSQSGIFTVTNGATDQELLNEVQAWLAAPSGTAAPDQIAGPQTSSQAPGATDSPLGNPGTLPGGNSSNSGGSGLSAGAIAGIAVGGAVALALIAGLVWFLLRRRRRRQNQQPGDYKPGHQTPTAPYLDDKDMHTGQVADSPRSPYSEDGQGVPHLAALPAAATAPLTLHAHTAGDRSEHRNSAAASFEPYRPDAAASRGNLTDSDAPTPTPQNVSRNVAHLVEEGMTEAEIRRLEEEERQLDDEIERAGRR
ncbi:hypothetical protein PCL_07497 [Purpureocillium lilacinum]|uniref:Uncharacterized protein n=2 Tax=Purpureocillium lilacinum TaxID=33203 RepID=A0A2U3EI70_PURLI|nr:hypothetical protein Purlil1_8526 [Purpureocillium lilacinum]PWI74183.1 hypothetical protein PCL_07497 [Purpureocillium lilacinum]